MRPLLLIPLLISLASCGRNEVVPNGCRSGYERPNIVTLRSGMVEAHARWTTANIRNYRYDFTQVAQPAPIIKIRITVQDGQVTNLENLGNQVLPPGVGHTVAERFGMIGDSIAVTQTSKCQELKVTYDTDDGHPLNLTMANATKGLADGAGQWTISNFTRL